MSISETPRIDDIQIKILVIMTLFHSIRSVFKCDFNIFCCINGNREDAEVRRADLIAQIDELKKRLIIAEAEKERAHMSRERRREQKTIDLLTAR